MGARRLKMAARKMVPRRPRKLLIGSDVQAALSRIRCEGKISLRGLTRDRWQCKERN